MRIGRHTIGPGHPCFIVAEMSANHGQNFDRAMAILLAAKEAGADAVKLQTYTPDTMTLDCDASYFRIQDHPLWKDRTLYQLYGEAFTPWEWHARLKEEADRIGLTLFSTPFDETAVDFLESLGMELYKIASFELVDIPLLERVAKTGKPVILSTGMATAEEIELSVKTLRSHGAGEIALLKCVSAYPADPAQMNLRTIPDMEQRFDVIAGLSDHSMGHAVALAAVVLGAKIIEKHFTVSRADASPDAAFSMEPAEFRQLVDAIREVEKALGKINYNRTEQEEKSIQFRRSIFAAKDIAAGDPFTTENIRVIRPGHGMAPRHYRALLGRKAKKAIRRGTPILQDCIE
ncbi:MAG TPA: pseudaminic acid synthase [Syntrophales bacterium]|nr:pseudaminic acid synthase [Syntrophales bacterium]